MHIEYAVVVMGEQPIDTRTELDIRVVTEPRRPEQLSIERTQPRGSSVTNASERRITSPYGVPGRDEGHLQPRRLERIPDGAKGAFDVAVLGFVSRPEVDAVTPSARLAPAFRSWVCSQR